MNTPATHRRPAVANGITVRCVDCQTAGRDRTFRSLYGYKRHVAQFHDAKPTDGVNVVRAKERA